MRFPYSMRAHLNHVDFVNVWSQLKLATGRVKMKLEMDRYYAISQLL